MSPGPQVEQIGDLEQFIIIQLDDVGVLKRPVQDVLVVKRFAKIHIEDTKSIAGRVLQESLNR